MMGTHTNGDGDDSPKPHSFETIRRFVLDGLLAIGLAMYAVCPILAQSSGMWVLTGSMNTARVKHTVTLLQNGQVLAAGGVNATGFLANAEIYDLTTAKWTSTGSMSTARGQHTATQLANGEVLVAGGLTNGNSQVGTACTATAELYNPATGQWTATGNMTVSRGSATATLLTDGRVLVEGGLCSGGFVYGDSGAEIYDPATGKWTATGSMSVARVYAGAALLQSGKVLIAGGSGYITSELFDTSKGQWRATGNMVSSHPTVQVSSFTSGEVLAIGGSGLASYGSELYRTTNGTWHNLQYGVAPPTRGHTLTLLATGKALVAGGTTKYGVTSAAGLLDPSTNSWIGTGGMTTARQYHAATLPPNGKVLVSGGQLLNSNGTATDFASAELYTP